MRSFLFLVLTVLSGCAGTAKFDQLNPGSHKLLRTDTAYVSVPKDGRYGSTVYHGSGQTVTQITAGAFARFMNRVESGDDIEGYKAALDKARAMGLKYLIQPRILRWEDRATEWSMISDRVSVKLSIIKVETGENVASVVINGGSSIATFGGDHPQDLLPKPINRFAAGLF